ncbi:hypothetical protein ACFW6S_04335 [Streptomyces sp. NPDC058740]|uniref:hypothetical protein n=1 Tax=Streptomyces sp. NPDC058740 TaxID=3346619 RepID=UPI0036A763FF
MYFEEHDAIFTALVAVLAIVGSYLAGVRGAKIQAKSGQDQASAARDAAEIAAEAQHVAALWNARQAQVAEFIRSVRELRRTSDHLFFSEEEGLLESAYNAYQEMHLRKVEIELTALKDVVDAADAVTKMAEAYWKYAHTGGPVMVADLALQQLGLGVDDYETMRAASRARRALTAEGISFMERRQALLDVPGLSRVHAARLALNTEDPGPSIEESKTAVGRLLDQKLAALVDVARTMLRSEDDVAPAVPPQRRWWQRASA